MQTNQNTKSQSKRELEKANLDKVRKVGELNIIDDINVKNADTCLEMGIKIKGLIFILDTFLTSLEMDKYSTYHKYIQDGISCALHSL